MDKTQTRGCRRAPQGARETKSAQGPSSQTKTHATGQMCGSQNKSLFMYFFKIKVSIFLTGKIPFFLKVTFTDFRSLSHKRNPGQAVLAHARLTSNSLAPGRAWSEGSLLKTEALDREEPGGQGAVRTYLSSPS